MQCGLPAEGRRSGEGDPVRDSVETIGRGRRGDDDLERLRGNLRGEFSYFLFFIIIIQIILILLF
jgi:hypothetical protein